jgi:hypothetical protein
MLKKEKKMKVTLLRANLFGRRMNMKKLLVLLMVLGLVSAANAALTVSISGPNSLETDETGTYTIDFSGADIISADVDVISDSGSQPYGIGGGVVIATGRNTGLDWADLNTSTGNYELTAGQDNGETIGGPLFTFEFTAPSAIPSGGTVTLSMIELSFFDADFEMVTPSLGTMEVTITPEPMTIALLGLGGLFLRRRK